MCGSAVDGLNYRLYRVRGEFCNAFDFRDYPFDSQRLKQLRWNMCFMFIFVCACFLFSSL
jgi:hypothetical protein